jgi:rhodanese-related sulfurtransferase
MLAWVARAVAAVALTVALAALPATLATVTTVLQPLKANAMHSTVLAVKMETRFMPAIIARSASTFVATFFEATMPVTVSAQALVEAALREVRTLTPQEVLARLQAGDATLQLVDVRDVRELQGEGTAEGAYHAPRCMLEFWVDPASPYHKPRFADESKEFVLFCGLGWRSALAAKSLQEMGMRNVSHIEGGSEAMRNAGFAWGPPLSKS